MLPPEMEVRADFEQPQASQRFVYSANPERGTVSIINAETLTIETLETGDRPTFLQTLRDTDDAIVLNVGSADATILRSPGTRTRTSTVDVVRGANAIAVAPDGKHAVVYFNAGFSTAGAASGSFQDVTVINLAGEGDDSDSAVGMTVGFRPREVFFSADSRRAFVVTDDGISVLDFQRIDDEGTGIAQLIELDSEADQQGLDVSVTPDGHYALARRPGTSIVRLVDLENDERHALDLATVIAGDAAGADEADAGEPVPVAPDVSDLDLAPNGAFALAVVRNAATVLRIPVPGGFTDPTAIELQQIDGEVIGSVTISPGSDRALLYTTAADIERMTILALDGEDDAETVALRKTVQAVAIAPDGETALIIHKKAEGDPNQPGIAPDLQIDRSHGYSVLRLDTGDVKLQVTPTPPGLFTMVPDGSYLFLLFGSGVREVQKVEAKSFLVSSNALGSPPISLGTVPGSQRVFVSQDHPDGRITFIDWVTNQARTVTGFELNSRIQD